MVQLAVLDVNETLFSLDAVAERLAGVGLEGALDVWFARVLRDGFAASAAGASVAFPDLARHHLAVLLAHHEQPVRDDLVSQVIDGFNEVTAHADVEEALRTLGDAGVTVATMTNGTVGITRNFLQREGLDHLVDATYDVAQVGRWKPAPEPYRFVLDRHDVAPAEAALIAVHPWDVQGAIHVGLTGVWVNRAGVAYPDPLAAPDVEGATLADAVEALLNSDDGSSAEASGV